MNDGLMMTMNVVNQFYAAKRMHPNIPFYLQDENGETFVFGWDLIYQYIKNLQRVQFTQIGDAFFKAK